MVPRINFIMVNPARGENVGFAARALKTIGFDSLRIVGKAIQNTREARKTGYGSHDLLDKVKVYPNLEASLTDVDLSIGTTAKQRIKRYDYHLPDQINKILSDKQEIVQQVALVFGSEENGLSTEELDRCDLVSNIPLATTYPSLNLAQSILIYAWELSAFREITPEKSTTVNPGTIHQEVSPTNSPAQITPNDHKNQISDNQNLEPGPVTTNKHNQQLQRLLKDETIQLLRSLRLSEKPILEQRIMDRIMLLNAEDSELVMTVLNKLKRKG